MAEGPRRTRLPGVEITGFVHSTSGDFRVACGEVADHDVTIMVRRIEATWVTVRSTTPPELSYVNRGDTWEIRSEYTRLEKGDPARALDRKTAKVQVEVAEALADPVTILQRQTVTFPPRTSGPADPIHLHIEVL